MHFAQSGSYQRPCHLGLIASCFPGLRLAPFAEPSTYLLGLVFGGNALIDLDGTPFNYMRYGGWLATCPVLLILLSNMPLSRKLKKPTDTLTLLILDQLMIVFGVGAIIYGVSPNLKRSY